MSASATEAELTEALALRAAELHKWRSLCEEAEASVRALKQGARHAAPLADSGGRLPARRVDPRAELRDSAGAGCVPTSHLESIEAEVSQKSAQIMELQASTGYELQRIERQRMLVDETRLCCREELQAMTQRAQSLAAQVQKSKRKGQELAALRRETAELASGLEEYRAARGAEGRERCSEAVLAVPRAPQVNGRRVAQSVGALRKTCAELQRELRARRAPRPGEPRRGEEGLERLIVQLERLHASLRRGRSSVVAPCPPSVPMHSPTRRPTEEAEGRRVAPEALQRELDDYNDAELRARESLLVEQSEELDALAEGHDEERRELHQEAQELREACLQVLGARRSAAQPRSAPASAGVAEEVAAANMELGAQLAEVRRCHLEHHEREEHEAAQLASAFEACRAELASVQAEFQGLALLFEKERRSHAELRHMQRELEQRRIQRQRAEAAAASTSVGQCALPPQDDVVATLPPPQREGADTLTIMPGGPAVDTVVADVPAGQPCAELPLAVRLTAEAIAARGAPSRPRAASPASTGTPSSGHAMEISASPPTPVTPAASSLTPRAFLAFPPSVLASVPALTPMSPRTPRTSIAVQPPVVVAETRPWGSEGMRSQGPRSDQGGTRHDVIARRHSMHHAWRATAAVRVAPSPQHVAAFREHTT